MSESVVLTIIIIILMILYIKEWVEKNELIEEINRLINSKKE